MDKISVIADLINLLKEYQEELGEKPQEITHLTCPLRDLPSFDSLISISFTQNCFKRYDIKDDKTISLLFSSEPKRNFNKPTFLTVENVAERICTMIKTNHN